jgi:hypothetical protein
MPKGNKPFLIKRNDTAPNLIATVYQTGCLGQNGRFNLSGATDVTFSMSNKSGSLIIASRPANIVSASSGIIEYSWKEGDTTYEGDYHGEFEITFADGKKMSLPREGFISIKITEDINTI